MHGFGYGMWGFGWIFWLAIAIIIVWLVFRVILGGNNRATFGKSEDTAEDILKKRYARGEIDQKEYDEKMKNLHKV
jgi:putative membrane protein